ncbi:MAG: hypothetical protein AABY22_30295 [Nanoarchaeota archaeon]
MGIMITKYKDEELKEALNEMVKAGYPKKIKKGYIDSDRVKSLLKQGKSRKQITKILDGEYKNGN